MNTSEIKILRPADIMEIYGFTQNEAYAILHREKCPTITGNKKLKGKRQRWTVEKLAFERFLRGE